MHRACCLPTPSGPFTAPVPERASLSSMGPLLGSSSQLSTPTGQRLACWSSLSGVQHMSSTEGTSDLCHMPLALLSRIQKKPNVTQPASAHSGSSRPCWPPPQEVTSLYGRLSRPWAAPLSEYGQPLPSKELSPVQGYRGNGVDRVTDTTNHQSGLNYSWGHWGICLVTCGWCVISQIEGRCSSGLKTLFEE